MRYLAYIHTNTGILHDDLTAAEFEAAKRAIHCLDDYVEAQETFRALIDNYSELELALMQVAQENLALGHISHTRSMQQRLLLDRRYTNFLSSCRLYLDYATALSLRLGENCSTKFISSTKSEYDGCLGYRVMDALRNYAQHRSLPLSGFTAQSRLVDRQKNIGENYTVPNLSIDKLRGDSRFKKKVFLEIEKLGKEPIDLRRWTRQYVDGISKCHKALVEELAQPARKALELYKNAMRRFNGRVADEGYIVRYDHRSTENKVIEQLCFCSEISDHIEMLTLENRDGRSFENDFISNALNDSKD